MPALSSICCPSHKIPFSGHCSRLSCQHWFSDLRILEWESVLVTWFGHPENNSMLSVNSWSSKLQSDFFPEICYGIVYIVCVCVCRWGYIHVHMYMNVYECLWGHTLQPCNLISLHLSSLLFSCESLCKNL